MVECDLTKWISKLVPLSGETHTYSWNINKNTGPTAEQEECSVSAYYSTVDIIKVFQHTHTYDTNTDTHTRAHTLNMLSLLSPQDMHSGLIGPLVICRRSWARRVFVDLAIESVRLSHNYLNLLIT